MGLETAIYTSKEGLVSHGLAMAVVGDNLANVNTVGFKASRAQFATLIGEGIDGRDSDAQPDGSGNGVKISQVSQIQELGTIESTSRSLDAAIDGSGFFVVGDTSTPLLTRAGDLVINRAGFLSNSDGLNILGYGPTDTTFSTLTTLDMLSVTVDAVPSTEQALVGNLDSTSAVTTPPTNPESFSDLSGAAKFSATSEVIDSLGESHTVSYYFFKTANNTWTVQGFIDAGEVGGTAGVPQQVGDDLTLNFTSTGGIETAAQADATMTLAPTFSNGADTGSVTVSFGQFRQQAAPFSISAITDNGTGVGTIQGYSLEGDGRVVADLSNGETVTIGYVALATVPNQDALEKVGNNLLFINSDAGDPTYNIPGTDGRGSLKGASLERSTVDVATQFTDMILFQRGYQGNAQMMTSANELIQQTINLMR